MIALVAGALLPLSFAPFHFYFVAVFSLSLLFKVWSSSSAKQAAVRGFLFGTGFFGVGVSWVYVAIHEFGQSSVLLAGFLTALFVAFLASYLALLAWAIKKLSREEFTPFDFILLLPVAWLIFEWCKGWFLTGFPWLELGVGQIDGALNGYTPVIGVLGVSLLVALSAGLLTSAWQNKVWWPLAVIICIWAGGEVLKTKQWTQVTGETLKVSMIQGNIPQEIKWEPEQLVKTLKLYQMRTEQNWDSDLIIWPENAIPVFYHQAKTFFIEPLARLAREHNTELLIGLPVKDEQSDDYYNSLMLLGQQRDFYHKSHLVPFGDYVPLEWLRGLIAFFDLPMSSFSPGVKGNNLLRVADFPVGLSICYEDVFSTELLPGLPQAKFLVNATNNAWYGDSFAPHQHLQISQNRALELGRPILRSTTNGISALIDYRGNLVEQTAQFQEAVLTVELQPRTGSTPYVQWGQLPLWLLSLLMMLMWGYYRRFNVK